MSVLENFKNIPRSPYGGATGLKCNFFSSNLQRSPWREKKEVGLSPPQRAIGPCHPWGGRQAPVARWGDMPLFFARDLVANLKKKITLRACRPMEGDWGIFLTYFKTDIYF